MTVARFENGTITQIDRLYNSVNGNPRFAISYETDDRGYEHRITSSDISDVYEVGNPGFRVGDRVHFGLTRAGRICQLLHVSPVDA